MADTLQFEIITPDGTVFSEAVDEVVIPTPDGEIGILPHHVPLVSLLQAGEVRIRIGDEITFLAVSSGLLQVHPDKVVALADTAERAEQIDEQRAEEARTRAAELMADKRVDSEEFAALSAKIEKELARLRVAKRRTTRRVDTIRPQL
ncbi:MAG: F0F1 ATP synthase subunit epsilon [Candidatus Kerfeldbacteria bacterium]|nr:F0F1 ATP synthase subunit epsilon [Candidatus Kerfeldbacteria bacterium]